ncbi:CRISPR-associated helicase/endonuclease Cas3 [Actinomadura kijaniata]|uniref:CRISPR-associated helicase/endonuclease Cas3 n=1 Tax=Actinomadura kijaniata TaxID=46161 RepID=UPI000829D230|nr:CRISPR-associated helicase/endonuclease Cas3 [Actinomadura kijaniata]
MSNWVWGKAGSGNTPHPLLCHMLDAAHVAEVLFDRVLPQRLLDMLAGGIPEGHRTTWVCFLVGAHDVGKASWWQMLRSDLLPSQVRAGIADTMWRAHRSKLPHGLVSSLHLRRWLVEQFGAEPGFGSLAADAVGGHHGIFFTPAQRRIARRAEVRRLLGSIEWEQRRNELLMELARRLALPLDQQVGPEWRLSASAAALLEGLTAVSDWIASDERYFPYAGAAVDFDDYVAVSRARAARALDALGWKRWSPAVRTMQDVLPEGALPRPMQQKFEQLDAMGLFDCPGIVVVEETMGGGKTEIAQYAMARWVQSLGLGGFYFALPTQATSNQALDRMARLLGSRSEGETLLHLAHGAAGLNDLFLELLQTGTSTAPVRPTGVCGDGDSDASLVSAHVWFTARWRGLLAQCGVGTVDQLLRAVLRVRHNGVMHLGLQNKVVVIDEVHSYDVYMSVLMERLLEWLGRHQVPVVLLSATLPAVRRSRLVAAWSRGAGNPQQTPSSNAYPLITWAGGERAGTLQPDPPGNRPVQLERRVGDTPRRLAAYLLAQIGQGGCVAVVCNTVGRAQDLQQALAATGFDGTLLLFHSRFPHGRRHELERQILTLFGKDGDRPKQAIVIATQVIEQSLDLDFDLLVSDLAPVDLVLQRIGRLHRHDRPQRPRGLTKPRLVLVGVESERPAVFPAGSVSVYGQRTLLASWYALRDRSCLHVPGDIRLLTESVYGDTEPALDLQDRDGYAEALAQQHREHQDHQHLAANRCIPSPDPEELHEFTALPDTDDLADSGLTRLGQPAVDVVLLEQRPDGRVRPVTGGPEFLLDQPPNSATETALIRAALPVSSPHRLVRALARAEPPQSWARSAWLAEHRALVLQNGTGHVDAINVAYDHILGLRTDPAPPTSRK